MDTASCAWPLKAMTQGKAWWRQVKAVVSSTGATPSSGCQLGRVLPHGDGPLASIALKQSADDIYEKRVNTASIPEKTIIKSWWHATNYKTKVSQGIDPLDVMEYKSYKALPVLVIMD